MKKRSQKYSIAGKKSVLLCLADYQRDKNLLSNSSMDINQAEEEGFLPSDKSSSIKRLYKGTTSPDIKGIIC